MSEKKYVLVDDAPEVMGCDVCAFKGAHCMPGCGKKHYILNPAYKPPSQRVRELVLESDDEGLYVSPMAARRLADELAEEEREEG